MKKRADADKNMRKRDQSLEDQIYYALIEKGWLIPQTEEDVLRAERALAQVECPPLPVELADPYRIIDCLDEAFEPNADMTSVEIEDQLQEIGFGTRQSPSLSSGQVLTINSKSKSPAFVCVPNESLSSEPTTDEVKILILEVRELGRQERYKEALELARQATLLEPRCWRAWISYGSLQALSGNLDEGEAIFRRILKDFSDNPKAVAAALHACGFGKEVRCNLDPSEEDLRELLPYYEEAIRLDDSRVDTRACLFINLTKSRQIDKGQKLFEDSLLYEGFLPAMKFQIDERSLRVGKTYTFLPAIPMRYRNILCSTGPSHFGNTMTSAAY